MSMSIPISTRTSTRSQPLRPRALLITLDAFGTLYRPRRGGGGTGGGRGGIANQYLKTAKAHGLDINYDAVDARILSGHLQRAFRAHQERWPNYGKGGGGGSTSGGGVSAMNPEKWWASVVRDTFQPLINSSSSSSSNLSSVGALNATAASLYDHFSTRAGYQLFPDVLRFLQEIGFWKGNSLYEPGWRPPPELDAIYDVIIMGVLTNSDPRVAGVLESLGVEIAGVGAGATAAAGTWDGVDHELDFVLTSYDCGYEKPDPRMFEAAEQQARGILLDLSGPALAEAVGRDDDPITDAIKVHIGDDLHKDYWGAIRSRRGWDAILLDREADEEEPAYHGVEHITTLARAPGVLSSLSRQRPRR